ncbi:hypothetical protein STAFG_4190 [Streptomyces afghaniensis 772]|uniref:Uncharacterized protein n=1 Tax=Streptomyces afghaniensis 772 TaxID=1283301 RepID=S4MXY1_9ACTN|nr:hypothetical protein STAFG_4190 [Streptomyces afghaniensis 772]
MERPQASQEPHECRKRPPVAFDWGPCRWWG